MSTFWTYFSYGLEHVLNIHAYGHILFLFALVVSYDFKYWKKLLILISLFTLGHTLSLLLTVFDVIFIKTNIVDFIILITILITASYNILSSGKTAKKNEITFIAVITTFFGIIHGLGFSSHFNSLISSAKPTDKLLPLFEFSLGIQMSQIVVVFIALLSGYVIQTLFKFSKRDWVLTISAFTIGVVLPMVLHNKIWFK